MELNKNMAENDDTAIEIRYFHMNMNGLVFNAD